MSSNFTDIFFEIEHHKEFPLTEDIQDILYAIDEGDLLHAPKWYQDWFQSETEGKVFDDWLDETYDANVTGANYEMTERGLKIHSDSSPCIKLIAGTIFLAFRNYQINEHVETEYSFSRSGGGAAFITKDGFKVFTTRDWLDEQVASLKKA